MAELDYAFIADYSVVQGGKLTAVGASYTHLRVRQLGIAHNLFVAGRIRAPKDFTEIAVAVIVTAPEGAYKLVLEGQLNRPDNIRPYDGKVGLLFSIGTVIAISVQGLYEVTINIDGDFARRLAFAAEVLPAA